MPKPNTRANAFNGARSSGSASLMPRYSASPSARTVTVQQLDNKLADMSEQLTQSVVAQVQDIIAAEVNKSFENLKSYMNEQLAQVQDDINNAKQSLDALKSELTLLKRKFLRQENAAVATEIRLHGVPVTDDENILDLLTTLCTTLEIPLPEIIDIKRINKISNIATNTDTQNADLTNAASSNTHTPVNIPILIKLSTPQSKNTFLQNLSNFRRETKENLRLKHMGLDSEKEIFFNEQLTKTNHKILKTAVGMKKKNKLWSVFTRGGIIYVKKGQSDRVTRIESLQQLRQMNVDNSKDNTDSSGFRGFADEN